MRCRSDARVGSDRIGSDRIGSDRIGSDRTISHKRRLWREIRSRIIGPDFTQVATDAGQRRGRQARNRRDFGNALAPKVVALTFDDGGPSACTAEITAILKQHGAHATFFEVGKALQPPA